MTTDLNAELIELRNKLEIAEAKIEGMNETAQLLLEAKNQWRDRARAAEAANQSTISALNPKPGDVLCVRTNPDLHPTKEQFTAFANALRSMLPEGVQAFILPSDVSVTCMDPAAMCRAGWVKADKPQAQLDANICRQRAETAGDAEAAALRRAALAIEIAAGLSRIGFCSDGIGTGPEMAYKPTKLEWGDA